jgi:hypothetical protein
MPYSINGRKIQTLLHIGFFIFPSTWCGHFRNRFSNMAITQRVRIERPGLFRLIWRAIVGAGPPARTCGFGDPTARPQALAVVDLLLGRRIHRAKPSIFEHAAVPHQFAIQRWAPLASAVVVEFSVGPAV